MRPYVIRQGDYLTRLASELGFDADAVWADDKNAGLRAQRRSPEVLHPGDVLYVPDAAPEPLELKTEAHNRFVGTVPTVPVSVVLRDLDGRPKSGETYTLHGLGREPVQGQTGGDGAVRFDAPVTVQVVRMVLASEGVVRNLRVGGMDPATERSGLRQRLAHLGFYDTRPGRGDEAQRLEAAIRNYQRARGLRVTGTLDAETIAKLLEEHQS
jgi:hypothetical protein